MNTNTNTSREFFKNTAKKWQDYIPYDFMKDITLSLDQKKVIDLNAEQLMIMGCAGSGKSITLLYKMIKTMMTEEDGKRILYVSYNQSLVDDAKKRAERSREYESMCHKHTVHMKTFHYMAYGLLKKMHESAHSTYMSFESIQANEDDAIRRINRAMDPYTDEKSEHYQDLESKARLYKTHSRQFVRDEIFWMKANGLIEREAYNNASRAGRGSIPRLERAQRNTIFDIYCTYQQNMKIIYGGRMDLEDYALALLKIMERIPDEQKYDYIFVDEVQDLQPMQLKVLAALTKEQLILSGDNKQRIYKTTNHTYENLGLGTLKRRTLTENYRSTKQIMALANKIQFNDLHHEKENIKHYGREGKEPVIAHFTQAQDYWKYFVERIKEIHLNDSRATIAIIIRNDNDVVTGKKHTLHQYLETAFKVIDIKKYGARYSYESKEKQIVVTDPYSVKGLEFDYVFIADFDREHYPLKSKFQDLDTARADQKEDSDAYLKDREAIINNEKRILYVAMTRAKKELELVYCKMSKYSICQFLNE